MVDGLGNDKSCWYDNNTTTSSTNEINRHGGYILLINAGSRVSGIGGHERGFHNLVGVLIELIDEEEHSPTSSSSNVVDVGVQE